MCFRRQKLLTNDFDAAEGESEKKYNNIINEITRIHKVNIR